MTSSATVHIDGGARGNPGPAAYALVLRRPGQPVYEECAMIGTATNNVAEYTALIHALERAAEFGVRDLSVFSDSELLVKQMKGEYRVKSPDLQDLYKEAQSLAKAFDSLSLTHVRRAQNADADRLCNEAMDGRPRRGGAAPHIDPIEAVTIPSDRRNPDALEEEAVALLNAVRASWTTGHDTPSAIEVWDKLWALLGEHGVLKKRK